MPAVALQGQFKAEAGIGLECREFAVGAGFCVVKGGGRSLLMHTDLPT